MTKAISLEYKFAFLIVLLHSLTFLKVRFAHETQGCVDEGGDRGKLGKLGLHHSQSHGKIILDCDVRNIMDLGTFQKISSLPVGQEFCVADSPASCRCRLRNPHHRLRQIQVSNCGRPVPPTVLSSR